MVSGALIESKPLLIMTAVSGSWFGINSTQKKIPFKINISQRVTAIILGLLERKSVIKQM